MKLEEPTRGLITERIKIWHNSLSHKAKLVYYGVLGNAALSLMDGAASLGGGKGSVVNLLHNSGDVASYGLRSLVASDRLSESTSKRMLLGANMLALSLTSWLTVKSGLSLIDDQRHTVEAAASYLELSSSAGNFTIASALGGESDHGHDDHKDQALQDGHHHAKTDAWASLIAAGGLSLASANGDSRFDSAGALIGGLYFTLHMLKHMFGKKHDHAHHH
jgi:hypothetical protein